MIKEDYRPENIEFNAANDGTSMPASLGEFETLEEAGKFVGANMTALNRGVTVSRHMDLSEKESKRDEYSDVLENLVPVYEKELSAAEANLTNAKASLKSAQEAYDFVIGRAKGLAAEAKRGMKDFICDEKDTWRVPYKGRFYFYTYVDGQLKLCLIREIAESEKTEIWSQMAGNEEFIDREFGAKKASKKK